MNLIKKLSQTKWTIFLAGLYGIAVVIGLVQIFRGPGEGGSEKTRWFSSVKELKTASSVVAVVPVYGVITVSEHGNLFGSHGADRLARQLESLSEKDEVKAVVLRINSPGGSVGAVQEIYDQVIKLKESGKKVVVSIGDVAASGGYYIASAADKIYANPGSITGSIGVIFQVGDFQGLFKKIGVSIRAIKSAEHKDIASPFRTMSEKERKILQSIIDDAYGQFIQAVAEGRKLKKRKVRSLADGRIFTGSQAKSAGLIDALGNIEAAIAEAASLAGIEGKPKILRSRNPWDKFFSFLSKGQETALKSPLSKFGVRFAYLWEYSL